MPLADLNDVVFTGWDIFEDNVYEAAAHAKVLDKEMLDAAEAVSGDDQADAGGLRPVLREAAARHAREEGQEQARSGRQVIADIQAFKKTVDRVVMIWCGFDGDLHRADGRASEPSRPSRRAWRTNDIAIAPSQIYAYAALSEGVPFANGAPNLTVDFPAMVELSKKNAAPICGKDFKTGQTLMKTVLAPAFKARMLGVSGWFSTNILGNRDGEVLDDPQSFKTKEESKLGSLDYIFQPELYPDLYKDHLPQDSHQLLSAARRRQRGLGQHRHLRLAGLSDADQGELPVPRFDSGRADCAGPGAVPGPGQARRRSCARSGIQEWLSFYLKSPQTAPGLYPEHDLFIQSMKLKNTLRHIMGADLITHLGLEYYD